MIFGIKF